MENINSSIYGNPTALFRELLKYDRGGVIHSLFNQKDCYIKKFIAHHQTDQLSSIIEDFMGFCLEIGYDPMRDTEYYHHFHMHSSENIGDGASAIGIPELMVFWQQLSDNSKVMLLEHIGPENVKKIIDEGFYLTHHAFQHNNYFTIEKLAEMGVDFHLKNKRGKTPKDYALDIRALDLYLRFNPENSFHELKKWFTNNIANIDTYKHYRDGQVEGIKKWLDSHWNNFSLSQKQEMQSIAIGSTTKEIYSFIRQKEKIPFSSEYPLWLYLNHCKVKSLGLQALKNTSLLAYYKENKENNQQDSYFLEKMASLFETWQLPAIMMATNPTQENYKTKALAESYFAYKDIWLSEVGQEPMLHVMAKRKNDVFKIFGEHWVNIKNASQLQSDCYQKEYLVQDMEERTYLRIPINHQKISDKELMQKTWLFQDKEGTYTFEYFLQNHSHAITYNFMPSLFKTLMMPNSTYHMISSENLSEKTKQEFISNYWDNLSEDISPDVVFKVLKGACAAFENIAHINAYGTDQNGVYRLIRACHHILSSNRDDYDYSPLRLHSKLKDYDPTLYQELCSTAISHNLQHKLHQKGISKQPKI